MKSLQQFYQESKFWTEAQRFKSPSLQAIYNNSGSWGKEMLIGQATWDSSMGTALHGMLEESGGNIDQLLKAADRGDLANLSDTSMLRQLKRTIKIRGWGDFSNYELLLTTGVGNSMRAIGKLGIKPTGGYFTIDHEPSKPSDPKQLLAAADGVLLYNKTRSSRWSKRQDQKRVEVAAAKAKTADSPSMQLNPNQIKREYLRDRIAIKQTLVDSGLLDLLTTIDYKNYDRSNVSNRNTLIKMLNDFAAHFSPVLPYFKLQLYNTPERYFGVKDSTVPGKPWKTYDGDGNWLLVKQSGKSLDVWPGLFFTLLAGYSGLTNLFGREVNISREALAGLLEGLAKHGDSFLNNFETAGEQDYAKVINNELDTFAQKLQISPIVGIAKDRQNRLVVALPKAYANATDRQTSIDLAAIASRLFGDKFTKVAKYVDLEVSQDGSDFYVAIENFGDLTDIALLHGRSYIGYDEEYLSKLIEKLGKQAIKLPKLNKSGLAPVGNNVYFRDIN